MSTFFSSRGMLLKRLLQTVMVGILIFVLIEGVLLRITL